MVGASQGGRPELIPGSVYNRFLQEQYDSDSVAPEPSQPVAPEPSQPVVPEPSQSNGAPRPSQLQDNNFVASAPSQPYLGPSVAPGPSQPYTGSSGTTFSPSEASTSPEEASPSPEEASPSPEEASPSPEEASPSPEEASPSPEEVSPSPPASASNTSKAVSTSTTVPAVQAVTTFSGFSTPSDFGAVAKANFINTIKASLSSYNVDVTIDNVSAGSIVVTSTTTFLDGSEAGANAFASTIGSSTAASALFPAATYGTVTSTATVQQIKATARRDIGALW
ncbi:TPA: hypothetical protein ACH3X2_001302 [Trebouxia sp. C0005]